MYSICSHLLFLGWIYLLLTPKGLLVHWKPFLPQKVTLVWLIYTCLFCKMDYLMIDWDGPPVRDCAGKIKSCHGNGGGGCVWAVSRWLDRRWQAEWRVSKRLILWSFAIPAAHRAAAFLLFPFPAMLLLPSSRSEWERGRRTNAECQWDSWEETHCLFVIEPLFFVLQAT